ncbi:hypothetical protein IMZ08_17365 [Bacillus luteolus]|uniref:Lipoprotein n=1 Tax=Litchfieldia luteola TaxID=682179 RepID=A0ABR9QMS5_9BACI|nr:hypothetical protein [Cytobacillus luteolus]MBE4909806.1 hypothetical protein [Cytobacillus luteolus]MBP1942647.1 hypothetical protein [Cytobacillus luteolus]
MNKRFLFLSLMFLLLVIFVSGCNLKNKEIIAKGKSENWEIRITFTMEGNLLNDKGNIIYLKNNPPKKIEWETIHPNSFPIGSAGTIEVYEENIIEHRIGGGGGSLNERDNYENLKERIDEMSVFIQWEIGGEVFNETVDLNVNE